MEKFLNYLYSKDEKYKSLIIAGVEYSLDENLLRIKVQYTCDTFSEQDKVTLEYIIKEYFDNKMLIECKLKKYIVDSDVIREYITKFVEAEYPSILSNSKACQIEIEERNSNIYKIEVHVDVENLEYLEVNNFIPKLLEHLSFVTIEEFEIFLVEEDSEEKNDRDILANRYKRLNTNNLGQHIDYTPIEVREIHNVVGEIDVDFVYPIATIQDGEKIVIVGIISRYKTSEFESKFKSKDGKRRQGRRASFVLSDGSDKINCSYFPNVTDEEKLDEFLDGEKVVVVGKVTDTEERGRLCRVRQIAKCDFDMFVKPEPVIELKSVNENYTYIFPKPYCSKTQSYLFTEEEKIDQFLMDNVVVVFDLETTGLNVNECEIIEIGAVKMVEGKIVETFDTLIKPKMPIPKDATAVNNITDEMVENCLYIEDVFPDFYKFIDGAVLVAYNIAYDYGCLKAYGDKNGYIFENKQVDALKLAKKALPGYKSHKLGKVVKLLGINLDNAHRALFDTVATAEVLKVTLNMITEEDKKQIL